MSQMKNTNKVTADKLIGSLLASSHHKNLLTVKLQIMGCGD